MKTQPPSADPPDLPEPLTKLRAMIRDRKITKSTFEKKEFVALLKGVEEHLNGTDPVVVWNALAILGRMAAVSKPAAGIVQPVVASRLKTSLPSFVRLPDSEDRTYLAQALEKDAGPDIVNLALQEIALEEASEKARVVWVSIAGGAAGSLSAFLHMLNEGLHKVASDERSTPDALCRRVRRIVNTIEDYLAITDIETGDNFGKELGHLMTGHLPRSGPEDRDLRGEAVQDFLRALYRIVRLNFDARNDPDSYLPVAKIRGWWHPATPPQDFERAVRSLTMLGMTSLLSFAKRGVRNIPLREALVLASGSDTVQRAATTLVARAPDLDESIAGWLITGKIPKVVKSLQGVDEMSTSRLDDYIARLLISLTMQQRLDVNVDKALEDIEDIMPSEAALLREYRKMGSPIGQWAKAIAKSRGISADPQECEAVRYDPAIHVGPDDLRLGSTAMVVSPGIVREGSTGVKSILVKAEVEGTHGR